MECQCYRGLTYNTTALAPVAGFFKHSSHLLIHSPGTCSTWSWTSYKAKSGNTIQVSHVGGRASPLPLRVDSSRKLE